MSDYQQILLSLVKLHRETEWLEFKHNNDNPEEIGEYLSALSNSAALHKQEKAFMVWGIQDSSNHIVGTDFKPRQKKIGNEELENWLIRLLTPRINFLIREFEYGGKHIVIFEIQPASYIPVRFSGTEYIRIGSYKKKLKEYPEKERELWAVFSKMTFEKGIAASAVSSDDVLEQLDYPLYFDITKQRLPDNRKGILSRLAQEKFIVRKSEDTYDITNLGAILFAKNLNYFDMLDRKSLRIVIYKGENRIETIREHADIKGYAACFHHSIAFINDHLPQNEQIGQALRKEVRIYPEIAIRELVANAIIHQDFKMTGTGPMVEVFSDRIEITNPGVPLIDTLRFIDEPPQSRNETLAKFMRRINICEERGSGIDKVIHYVELFQLPAPDFRVTTNHTVSILFGPKDFSEMDKADRIRAAYQHACFLFVSGKQMTNSSLRKRLKIEDKNYPMVSRIIKDTIEAGLIKLYSQTSEAKKTAKYVPFWA